MKKKSLTLFSALTFVVMGTSTINSVAQSTYTVHAEADAMVISGKKANTPLGTMNTLNVKGSGTGTFDNGDPKSGITKKAFLQFNLSDIPHDIDIESVKLRLYIKEAYTGSIRALYNLLTIDDNSWSENTITWNNAPSPLAPGTELAAHIIARGGRKANEYIDINLHLIRPGLKEKLQKSGPNEELKITFLMQEINSKLSGHKDKATFKFASKEDPNEKFRPVLIYQEQKPAKPLIIDIKEDAMVISGRNAETSFGTLDKLNIKVNSNNNVIKRAILKFNIPAIPAKEDIKSVVVRLYIKEADPSVINNEYQLKHIQDNTWSEGGTNPITWSNFHTGNNVSARNTNGIKGNLIGHFKGAKAGEYIDIDITQWVKISKGFENTVSFVVGNRQTRDFVFIGSKEGKIVFASKENPNEMFRPKLIINKNPGSMRQSSLTTSYPNKNSSFNNINPKISLFPNPANNHINLGIENLDLDLDGNIEIKVYNLLGTIVYNKQYLSTAGTPFKTTLPLNNVKPGIYLMNVTVNDKPYSTQRFIKK